MSIRKLITPVASTHRDTSASKFVSLVRELLQTIKVTGLCIDHAAAGASPFALAGFNLAHLASTCLKKSFADDHIQLSGTYYCTYYRPIILLCFESANAIMLSVIV